MTPQNKIKSEQVFSSETLSFIAACIIGDGSVSDTGRLVIAHGLQQADYADWKAERLSKLIGQHIQALPTRQCKQIQFQRKFLQNKRYSWYRNGRKNINEILRDVTNALETIAIWICDDGNVCPSIAKNGKCYSASIQIFTFTELEESVEIANWFEKHTGIRPKLHFLNREKTNRKSAYKLKFTAEDSRNLYKLIKSYIPVIPSMSHKFRYLEYNSSKSPLLLNLKVG